MICLHFIDSCSEEQDRALWIRLNEKFDSGSLFCLDGKKYFFLFFFLFQFCPSVLRALTLNLGHIKCLQISDRKQKVKRQMCVSCFGSSSALCWQLAGAPDIQPPEDTRPCTRNPTEKCAKEKNLINKLLFHLIWFHFCLWLEDKYYLGSLRCTVQLTRQGISFHDNITYMLMLLQYMKHLLISKKWEVTIESKSLFS